MTSPASGQTYNAPITLTASVTNSIGTISKVEFFEGANQIGPDLTSAPYTHIWTGASSGSHSIVAKATDSYNAVGTSDTDTFTVNDVPSVTLGVSPTSPASAPATLTLTATVTNTYGTISQVQFFNNGMLIGTDTTSPYSISWSSVEASGSNGLSLTAVATDSYGAVGTSSATAYTVNDSALKCYWKLDEGSGTSVADSSGNLNSTSFSGPEWQTGSNAKVINCLLFNNNYVQKTGITSGILPAASGAQTECFWFFVSDNPTNATKTALAVTAGTGSTVNGVDMGFIYSGSPQTQYFGVWRNSNNTLIATVSGTDLPTAGTWHHVAYRRVQVFGFWHNYLYIDGAQKADVIGTFDTSNATALTVGRTNYSSGANYWPGKIDEVRVYNRALSATEINALYNSGSPRQ